MFCAQCGTSNEESARFCAKCGTALAAARAPAAGTGTMRTASPGIGGQVVTGKNPTVALVTRSSSRLGWRPVLQRRLEEGPGDGRRLDPARLPSCGLVSFGVWILVDAYKVASGHWQAW